MTHQTKNFSVLAYANNFTMWHYITDNVLEDVKKSGYFDKSQMMLRKGDLIILHTKDQRTSVWVETDNLPVMVTEETMVAA